MAGRSGNWRTTRGILIALSVMLVMAACSSSLRSAPPSKPATHGSSAAASPPASASPAAAGAQNLVASSSLKADLFAAYVAFKKMPADEFTPPGPGGLYYGIDNTTGTYWAVGFFGLTSSASYDAKVDMQDGGNTGVFSRQGDQPWTVRLGNFPFPCPGALPADLMTVWGMTSPGICVALMATSPAKAQATYSPALDLPAGTYFGAVLYEQLSVDGHGYIDFEPETWQGAASPASHSHTYFSLDNSTSTVTGYWTGNSRSDSHEVLGSFDLAFAQRVQSAMVPFMTQPLSGYEVTVSIPVGCSGACSEFTKIVQLNSVAPLPAQPNFTEPGV